MYSPNLGTPYSSPLGGYMCRSASHSQNDEIVGSYGKITRSFPHSHHCRLTFPIVDFNPSPTNVSLGGS
jgi:hypothetical protein